MAINTEEKDVQKVKEETVKKVQRSAIEGIKRAKDLNKRINRKIIVPDEENPDEELFSFRIRPLHHSEYENCRDQSKKKGKRGQATGEINQSRFYSKLIYLATVDEDKFVWNSPEILDYYDTNFPEDVIEDALTAGYKIEVVSLIEEISGFTDDGNIEVEDLKN